jgi:hypothetical protein
MDVWEKENDRKEEMYEETRSDGRGRAGEEEQECFL